MAKSRGGRGGVNHKRLVDGVDHRRKTLGLVVRLGFALGLLRHYRCRELAICGSPTIAVPLHASGVQTRSSATRLVRPCRHALRTTAMRSGAVTAAESLPAVARRAHTELNPAAHARQQSPGLLGGQARAEVRHFLDETPVDQRHRSSVWRIFSARSPEGSGGYPGLQTFSAMGSSRDCPLRRNFTALRTGAEIRRSPALSAEYPRFVSTVDTRSPRGRTGSVCRRERRAPSRRRG
jgi:hypothetical protein